MPGFNLVRNAKVLFTNNTNASTGAVTLTGHTATTTYELQVLNGFSFSQNTETQNITVSEAGLDPARGQRTFNTALAPVEFSFSTYIRPKLSGTVSADEKQLWNALFSDVAIDTTGTSLTVSAIARTGTTSTTQFTFTSANLSSYKVGEVITIKGVTDTANPTHWNAAAKIVSSTPAAAADGTLSSTATVLTVAYLQAPGGTGNPTTTTGTIVLYKGAVTQQTAGTAHMLVHSGRSNKNSLVKFGLIVVLDDQTYIIDNCALNQASIDFGLDGIAQVSWSGYGTAMRGLGQTTMTTGTFGGAAGVTGSYQTATTDANFITNKLSTVTLSSTLGGLGTGATAYTLALTGGNLTINNNINYVTPEILGVVNQPIGYFTGTRAISGNVTAYLKTGTTNTGGLLSTMLAAATTNSETKYSLGLQVGGSANSTRVDIAIPGCMLQIPSVETQDVMSTTINFTAQGYDGSNSVAASMASANYDLESTNDFVMRYYSA